MIHKVWMTKYEVKNIQLWIMTTNRLILAKGILLFWYAMLIIDCCFAVFIGLCCAICWRKQNHEHVAVTIDWCLTPTLTIFQLYRGSIENHRSVASHCELYHIMLYRVYLAINRIGTYNFISERYWFYKYIYHTITTFVSVTKLWWRLHHWHGSQNMKISGDCTFWFED
jgi:hypothetical protein